MLNNRDQMILKKIIEYCRQITETVTRFGADYETYCGDFVYRNACCMCILQIGELVGKLTEEFTTAHTDIPWRSIRPRAICLHMPMERSAQKSHGRQ